MIWTTAETATLPILWILSGTAARIPAAIPVRIRPRTAAVIPVRIRPRTAAVIPARIRLRTAAVIPVRIICRTVPRTGHRTAAEIIWTTLQEIKDIKLQPDNDLAKEAAFFIRKTVFLFCRKLHSFFIPTLLHGKCA